jgi:hypothetical protein
MHQANAFIPLGAAALGVGLYTLFHPGLRKGNGDSATSDEADQLEPGARRPPACPPRSSRLSLRFSPGTVWTPSGPECDDVGNVSCPPRLVRRPCSGPSADGLRRATHRVKERISHVWSSNLSRARPVSDGTATPRGQVPRGKRGKGGGSASSAWPSASSPRSCSAWRRSANSPDRLHWVLCARSEGRLKS